MDTSSIKSNSISSRKKTEEKSNRAVLPEGAAKIAKPSRGEKLMEDANAIKDYVKSETPGLFKRFLRELLQGLLNTFLPGGGGPNRNYSSNGTTMTEYNRSGGYNYSRNGSVRASNTVYAYEALYFDMFDEAKTLLESMCDEIARTGYVTVFDMYDLAGVPANNTDMGYGWYNLSSATVLDVPQGYKLGLPRPVPIRK